MNKVVASPQEAIADMQDGATIAIAGFSVGLRPQPSPRRSRRSVARTPPRSL